MDEQKKFLETAETEYGWYYPMLKVMLLTGMRISEVGGLCWSDIDYDNDVIHIRRALFSQYEYGKKKLHFTTTKTINSERDIPMMEDCKKMLKLQKKNQNKIKKELGKRYRSENEEGLSDLVFTSSMGSAATRYNVAPIINKIVKSINLREDYESVKENRKPIYMEQVSPHALRRTFCTRCFEAGMNIKVVQKIMGHSNYAVTANIYTEVMPDKMNEEVELFNSKLLTM